MGDFVAAKLRGNDFARAGEWESALVQYRQAMDEMPEGADAVERAAVFSNASLAARKQFVGYGLSTAHWYTSVAYARAAVKARPKWPKAHARLASALEAVGDWIGARQAYLSAAARR
jgi:hypothetical protein